MTESARRPNSRFGPVSVETLDLFRLENPFGPHLKSTNRGHLQMKRKQTWRPTVQSSPAGDVAGVEVRKQSASGGDTSRLHVLSQSDGLRQLDQGNVITAKETTKFGRETLR